MLDHVGFTVADFAASRTFYLGALGAIGLRIVGEGEGWAMLGPDERCEIWFGAPDAGHFALGPPGAHIAFQVDERRLVEQFHAAGFAAGGRDNGGPGLRPHYHADYYAAFLLDPDGNNIEAVCHRPE